MSDWDWPDEDDARLCERCHKPVPPDWDYAYCRECGQGTCPHGKLVGECNACDINSDLEYDAWRENHHAKSRRD